MKRILITGAAGLIGRELTELLLKEKCDITTADLKQGNDLRNYNECLKLCEGVDEVYHLAGIKGSPKMTKESPATFMKMLQFDSNMIQAAQECKVKRFLYTSSIAVEHPQDDFYPAWAKMTAEKLIEAMRVQYPQGTKFVVVRPANVYGKEDLSQDNLMIVSSLIKNALKEKKIVLDKKGSEQVRDIIYAEDVARNMIKVMNEMPKQPVNICSGKGTSIKRIAKEISKAMNISIEYKDLNIILGTKKRIMKQNYQIEENVSLERGIKECVNYARTPD